MTLRSPCDEAVVRSRPEAKDCDPATGRWVLAAAILGSSITFIDGTVVNVVLPVLQGATAPSPLPACPSLRGQPCRVFAPYANTPSAQP